MRTLDGAKTPGVPSGAGSGGGPNKATWTPFEPQALLGLNSTVVYGGNVQIAFPTNFQLALGSNLQVCISPNAWQTLYGDGASSMSADFDRVLGSGLGGNMQLTMGTSANFVVGQTFDINLGPRRITLDVHNKTGIQATVRVWGTVIMAATAVFMIVYAAAADDDARASTVVIFQLLMQVFIIALMDIQAIYHRLDAIYKMQLDTLYSADPVQATKDNKPDNDAFAKSFTATGSLGAALISTGVVAAMVQPVMCEIAGESKLDAEPATETYDVYDDKGKQIGHVTI